MEMKDVPILLTIDELAKFMRVGRNTAYEYVRKGKVPYIRCGKQIRVYRGDVLALRENTPMNGEDLL